MSLQSLVNFASNIPELPQWLENCRVSEELTASAYDATPPECRAALKTGIALAAFHFGEIKGVSASENCQRHAGFWQSAASAPVPWTVLAFTGTYAAAARLCAAAILPVLADVRNILSVCIGLEPTVQALAGLELCGIEDVFCMDGDRAAALVDELAKHSEGRLVLLHEGGLASLARHAEAIRLQFHEESRKPLLLIENAESFSMETLLFCQGFAPENETAADSIRPDAVYCLPKSAQTGCRMPACSSLLLTPGCEGFWLHGGLTPDFFITGAQAFGLLPMSSYGCSR